MISGKNIVLRAPEPDDVSTIYRWENDPLTRVVSKTRVPVSAFAVEQYILNLEQDPLITGELRLMAIDREHGNIIGHLDLFEIDPLHRRAGIGILVDCAYRGKGFGKEMIETIAQWCHETLNLHQLWCTISADNQESIGLFLAAGFHETGKREEWTMIGGIWQDELFFQKRLSVIKKDHA